MREAPDLCGPILHAAQRMQDGRVVPIIEETPGAGAGGASLNGIATSSDGTMIYVTFTGAQSRRMGGVLALPAF
jgi:hypothetical protein